jgi:hypothetical protein
MIFALLLACTTGQSPVASDSDPGAACSEPTLITGEVRFPNGVLPVSGARVYLSESGAPAPRAGECGQCIDSAGLVWTTTGPDGRFELPADPGPAHVIVEKGGFRRRIEVDACGRTAIDPDASRLPGDRDEGELPRIAVLTGDSDALDVVLLRLGLRFDTFETFTDTLASQDAELSPAEELLWNESALFAYDVLLIECQSAVAEHEDGRPYPILIEPEVQDRLRRFVEEGGRLYVTDDAYEAFEIAIPSAIDFEGGTDGLADTPEGLFDDAQIGGARTELAATIRDGDLRAWLEHQDALEPDGTLHIDDPAVRWAVIEETSARAHVIATADIRWRTPDESEFSEGSQTGHRPLTVTAESGCGRAFVSSYHTSPHGLGLHGLVAQELVLAYALLEIGECILEPELI